MTTVAHALGRWRLLYFNAPTRGEQIRVLFKLAGVNNYDDVRLDYPRGLDPYKSAAMGDESPLCGTDMCPAVTSPEGKHVVETADIMRFIGKAIGFAPASEEADERAYAITVRAQDVLNRSFYKMLFPMIKMNILKEDLGGVLRWVVPKSLVMKEKVLKEARVELDGLTTSFEEDLSSGTGIFFFGDEMTYADVAVFTNLDLTFHLDCFDREECLGGRPKLKAFMETMGPKAEPWFKERTEKNQGGCYNIIEYLAEDNSPLKWSRKKKN